MTRTLERARMHRFQRRVRDRIIAPAEQAVQNPEDAAHAARLHAAATELLRMAGWKVGDA